MRYFLAAFALVIVAVVSIAGFRGGLARRPPIEVFSDMDRQPKVRPQTRNDFFADKAGSRPLIAGTIARATPLKVGDANVYAFEDHAVNTGQLPSAPGTTNFIELNPLPVTAEFMARGQQRYQITCLPCHGPQGDGKGITTKYGMVVIGNLHDPRIARMPDGELFNTISHGKNLMQGYAASIAIPDRWAIIAYVRALQLSHLASVEEVPAEHRAALPK
jgi:mono/diheme cytochrome c family protein